MKLHALAVAAALTVGCFTSAAYAADETFSFSGLTSQGAFSGSATLDIENGFAVSGGGTISGASIGDDQAFSLVTGMTPGAFDSGNGTFGYESNNGDEPQGLDDAVPLTGNGILFATNPADPSRVGNLLFGAYANADGTSSNFFYGTSSTGFRFYEQGSEVSISAGGVSAAPEPAAWALMLGGVGILGGMLRIASARRREDEASGMAAA